MQERNSWLFPVMVVAAAGMVAFGCIGIVAISAELSRGTTADNWVSSEEVPALDAQPGIPPASTDPGKAKLTTATVTPGLKAPKAE